MYRLLTRARILLAMSLLSLHTAAIGQVAEELCAVVQIEIVQELALERQAFEATMRITNSLDTLALEDVDIDVLFRDEDGNPVQATTDTTQGTAGFFIRVDDKQGVDNIEGTGSIAPASTAEVRWLIIPTDGAAGERSEGKLYFVGATLRYTFGGDEQAIEVAPDTIVVRPQPRITLDYFLTREVVADDAFTVEVEPPIPYTLGVRVSNNGSGVARSLTVDSAQPRILSNEQGLAVGFEITGSYLEDQPVDNSLLIDFSDIPADGVSTGRWIMQSTLSGEFTSFTASFSHADELGGQLTSLVEATNAHFLIHDVRVDLPGRDAIGDFLADDLDALRVYESEPLGIDEAACSDCSVVANLSSQSTLGVGQSAGEQTTHTLSSEPHGSFSYIQLADPHLGDKSLVEVVRSDGQPLAKENFWLSKSRAENGRDFDHYLNLFDAGSPGEYTVTFSIRTDGPAPPTIQFIADRDTYEGGQVGFLVLASDPNGTAPMLQALGLPDGARFTAEGDGKGVFSWFPAPGQAGAYPVTFEASDGVLSDQQIVTLTVNPEFDKDGDGLDDAWEIAHFGNLDRDGTGDKDGDGLTDREEFEGNTDPNQSDDTTPPELEVPVDVQVVVYDLAPVEVDIGSAFATDVSLPVQVTNDAPEKFIAGTTLVTWTATDAHGNERHGTQYVTLSIPAYGLAWLLPENGGDGSAGVVLNGVGGDGRAGVSVGHAGDVNFDGFDDVIIGAHTAAPSGAYTGESYVIYGREADFPAVIELDGLHADSGGDGSGGFALYGMSDAFLSAITVTGAGDFNNDGIADFLIGANASDADRNKSGATYLVYGRAGVFEPTFDLGQLHPDAGGSGTHGSILEDVAAGGLSWHAVASAGDVNGDGFDDILIPAREADPHGSKPDQAYIVFGAPAGFPARFRLSSLLAEEGGDGSLGFVLNGIDKRAEFGFDTSGGGDLNGDGFDDIIIGARRADGAMARAGQTYIVFGGDHAFAPELELSTLLAATGDDGPMATALSGIGKSDHSGEAVSNLGDVNGDGLDDLIVGAPGASPSDKGAGQAYVVFGTTQGFPAELELSSLLEVNGGDGSAGFALNGFGRNARIGTSVTGAGDVNGDGIADILIGAPKADAQEKRAGRSFVVFGRDTGFPSELELASLLPENGALGTEGYVIDGAHGKDQSGYDISPAGDVNGDGIADLLIGAPGAGPNGSKSGQAYILFGRYLKLK